MAAQAKIQIKNRILNGTRAFGNSKGDLLIMASDLLNQYGKSKRDMQSLVDGTCLSPVTIERMRTLKETETGRDYHPSYNTVKRVLVFFGAEATMDQVAIQPRFRNKPKEYL